MRRDRRSLGGIDAAWLRRQAAVGSGRAGSARSQSTYMIGRLHTCLKLVEEVDAPSAQAARATVAVAQRRTMSHHHVGTRRDHRPLAAASGSSGRIERPLTKLGLPRAAPDADALDARPAVAKVLAIWHRAHDSLSLFTCRLRVIHLMTIPRTSGRERVGVQRQVVITVSESRPMSVRDGRHSNHRAHGRHTVRRNINDPAMMTLRLCGRQPNHCANASSSDSLPTFEKSPQCNSTSPSGTLIGVFDRPGRSISVLCVSEMHTNLMAFAGLG